MASYRLMVMATCSHILINFPLTDLWKRGVWISGERNSDCGNVQGVDLHWLPCGLIVDRGSSVQAQYFEK